jgi:hypothetical protein
LVDIQSAAGFAWLNCRRTGVERCRKAVLDLVVRPDLQAPVAPPALGEAEL